MDIPSWVTDENSWKEYCRCVVNLANDLIEGRMGAVEASRKFIPYRTWFRAEKDPDFMVFVAIESETDHLPLGPVRQYWAKDSLTKKDDEIHAVDLFYREQALTAAQNIIHKYATIETLPN